MRVKANSVYRGSGTKALMVASSFLTGEETFRFLRPGCAIMAFSEGRRTDMKDDLWPSVRENFFLVLLAGSGWNGKTPE